MTETMNPKPNALALLLGRLSEKGWQYWLSAAAMLIACVAFAPRIEQVVGLSHLRQDLFQAFSAAAPRPLLPRFVKVVLIEDDEYYDPKGKLQHARPINRSYVADIVRALDRANVAIIALDISMPWPDARAWPGLGEFDAGDPQKREQTDDLVRAILTAASHRTVILAKEIAFEETPGRAGRWIILPNVLQPYGICVTPKPDGGWDNPGLNGAFHIPAISPNMAGNIRCGYVALVDPDRQHVPVRLDVSEKFPIDSFALAIARAWSPLDARNVGNDSPYGNYIREDALNAAHVIFSARAVRLGDQAVLHQLQFRPVIVGGHWHQAMKGAGDFTDMHDAPAGRMVGAIIHENFAEAILDGRLYAGIPAWVLTVLDVLFGIFAALTFAAFSNPWIKIALLGALGLLLLGSQYAMFIVFGTFFDALAPLFGLALHSLAERIVRP